jgi:mercuric ion binding protein
MNKMKNLLAALVAALLSTTPLLAQNTPKEAATAQQAEAAEWVTLKVTGITCAGCAGHIQKALTGKKGVLEHEVKYPGDKVKVKYDPKKIKSEDIRQAIIALGYKAEPVEDMQ